MKAEIDRDFSKFTEVNLSVFVHNLLWRLLNNPHFPRTVPSTDELREKLGNLKRALSRLLNGDDTALETVAANRQELEALMNDLADNLEMTAGNDREKLESTGFELLRNTSER